jgi:hypothetical protein
MLWVGYVALVISTGGWLWAAWGFNLLFCAIVVGHALIWLGGLRELISRIGRGRTQEKAEHEQLA